MSTTIITALYDIGRGSWPPPFNRSVDSYLGYFKNVLSMDANFVIFVEENMKETILKIRREFDPFLFKTKIYCKPLKELEVFQKYYKRTQDVMTSSFFLNNRKESHTPESFSPEYNLINFNKISFVEEVVLNNPFGTDYFMWMDAGFSHGKFPCEIRDLTYPNPEKIKLLDDDKIHFLSLCGEHEMELDSYFSPRVTLAGSMFAGKAKSLLKFKQVCFSVIEEFLDHGAMNDDQTIYAFAYMRNKNLFNLYRDNWFGNFKIFV